MSAPRVAHLNEAAIVDGPAALVGGYAAWFIAETLDRIGLDALLTRSGVPPARRAEVLRATAAIREVAGDFRLEQAKSASTSGSAEAAGAYAGLASVGHESSPSLSTRDAAKVLGVSDRRVRWLARASLLAGQRDVGGRWWFAPAEIETELQRRQEATK